MNNMQKIKKKKMYTFRVGGKTIPYRIQVHYKSPMTGKPMMPASTIVLKYIPWHHRVVEKGIERSLAVMIMGILVVLERILVVNVFLHRRGRVKLNELVLEFL